MRKSGLFAILAAAMVLAGCGSAYSTGTTSDSAVGVSSSRAAAGVSNSYDSGSYEEMYALDDITEAAAEDSGADYDVDVKSADDSGIAEVDTSKKIIRNKNYSLETTDLATLDQMIQAKVSELGGYIESSSIDGGVTYDDGYYLGSDGQTYYDTSYVARSGKSRQYRYAYYTIRIPAERLDEFSAAVENGANVTYASTTTQDITSSYVDTDARRKSYEEEIEVLNEMMQKAETVDEMIQIESQLSDVRYQLENIKSQLKSMDNDVAYSTVDLSVTEVTVLTDTTSRNLTWQERIANGFANSCERLVETSQEIVISIASNAPMIVFYIILIVIGLVILRFVIWVVGAILGGGRGRRTARKSRKAVRRNAAAEQAAAAQDQNTAAATGNNTDPGTSQDTASDQAE